MNDQPKADTQLNCTPAPYEAYGLTAEQWRQMTRRYVRARLDLKAEIAKRDAALAAQAAKEGECGVNDIERGIQLQRKADQVVINLQAMLDPDYSVCRPRPLSEGSWMITVGGQRRGIAQQRIYNLLQQVGAVGKSYLSSTGYVVVKFALLGNDDDTEPLPRFVKPVGSTVTIFVGSEVENGD